MKRVLLAAVALSALGFAGPAMAQERDVPALRAGVNVEALADRMRARGVADDTIELNMARIRAAIASGKYPHLLRRLYNATHGDEDVNRRRLLAADDTDRADRPQRRDRRADRPDRTRRPERDPADPGVRAFDPVRGVEVDPGREDVRNVRVGRPVRQRPVAAAAAPIGRQD